MTHKIACCPFCCYPLSKFQKKYLGKIPTICRNCRIEARDHPGISPCYIELPIDNPVVIKYLDEINGV